MSQIRIAVAGTGYVGLSIATLLAQYNQVTAVDIIPEKVDLINRRKSPIQDEYIEKYFAENNSIFLRRSTVPRLTAMPILSSLLLRPITTLSRIISIPIVLKM